MSRTATPAQIRLIRTIMSERSLEGHHIERLEQRLEDGLPIELVNDTIAWLKARDLRVGQATLAVEVAPRQRVSEEGFYKDAAGDVFKVVTSRSGRLYAKMTTARGLVYVEGAMRGLFADMKMTGEEIAAHGVANCYCVNCSTPLTDPTSKRIGLGTSCGPAILGKEGYKAARASVAHFEDVIAFEAAKKADAKARRDAKKAEVVQLEIV